MPFLLRSSRSVCTFRSPCRPSHLHRHILPQLVRTIADEVRTACSVLAPPRYKVIAHVVLREKDGEASAAASRALWSANEDALALKVVENDTMCAAASVWALYFE